MSDSSVSDYRKEVRGYLESCEYLLAATASSDNLPLSKEERSIIAHYAVEILTAVARPTTRS
jgi:hypothetical protein